VPIENKTAVRSDGEETRHQIRELAAASVRRHRLTPRTPEHAAALAIEQDLQAAIWRRLETLPRGGTLDRDRPDGV
jgi:hypothetical protein